MVFGRFSFALACVEEATDQMAWFYASEICCHFSKEYQNAKISE